MKLSRTVTILVQALFALGVMSLCTWSGASWAGTISLGMLIATATTASIPRTEKSWATTCELALSWICTSIAAIFLLGTFWTEVGKILGFIIGCATAISIIPAVLMSLHPAQRRSWKIQVVFWGFFGTLLFLYDACFQNSVLEFYAALVIICLLIIGCKLWFRSPKFLILAQNTAILFLIGLPLADLFVLPPLHTRITDETKAPYYYCESATHPGVVYECWLPLILQEWDRMKMNIGVVTQGHKGPAYRFKPNTKDHYYHSQVVINNVGFRGPDISIPKGKTFRIVAIGESTTFGLTLQPGDRPWPELLQQMIRTRLNLPRPVEVINAGFPTSTIEDSLWRLDQDILPLKPDMIISYHGINGFHLLDDAIPPLTDPSPPKYLERPLKILANLEYRWNVHEFNKLRLANLQLHPPTFRNVLDSKYAADTRRLVDLCNTNHITLVVGTFSLAVNSSSEKEVMDFYHDVFDDAPWTIRANAAYTKMLVELAKEQKTIHLVDTHPGLDGNYTNFTDIMHLTQSGRQKIADAFFAGIKDVLKTEVKFER